MSCFVQVHGSFAIDSNQPTDSIFCLKAFVRCYPLAAFGIWVLRLHIIRAGWKTITHKLNFLCLKTEKNMNTFRCLWQSRLQVILVNVYNLKLQSLFCVLPEQGLATVQGNPIHACVQSINRLMSNQYTKMDNSQFTVLGC